ncbi:MAG: hypothetical protein KIT31_18205 [Deltaproteobacteria bacterium]|nr:hypothetical protein [Deltaproteobacteria bacterium]
MRLLDIAAYRDLCAGTGAGEPVTAEAAAIARILAYARRAWRGVGLEARTLGPGDVARVVRRGGRRCSTIARTRAGR